MTFGAVCRHRRPYQRAKRDKKPKNISWYRAPVFDFVHIVCVCVPHPYKSNDDADDDTTNNNDWTNHNGYQMCVSWRIKTGPLASFSPMPTLKSCLIALIPPRGWVAYGTDRRVPSLSLLHDFPLTQAHTQTGCLVRWQLCLMRRLVRDTAAADSGTTRASMQSLHPSGGCVGLLYRMLARGLYADRCSGIDRRRRRW